MSLAPSEAKLSARSRDAPIYRPVIGIGRFLEWPAQISDRPVSLTSCWFRADPFIASGAGRDVIVTRTLTVACNHVVSHENDSNLNGIQCKGRSIMYLCCEAWTPWVSVWERQHILTSCDQSHSRTVVCLRATHSGVWLLNESTCLNESSESIDQWPIHNDNQLTCFWMNQPFEWIDWMN